jgi:DNA-binding transcriptional regulator YbjK
MYLAKHVGHWSLSQIGKFYNGRHHTTVLHAIDKIENLRRQDASLDALLEVLTAEISAGPHDASPRISALTRTELIETIVTRVMERLAGMQTEVTDADRSAHVPNYPSTLAMAARNSD